MGIFIAFALLLSTALAALGQCNGGLLATPAATFIDNSAQDVNVTVLGATGCAWMASSNEIATAGTPSATIGQGFVTYSITANTTGEDRSVTLPLTGISVPLNVVTITQRWMPTTLYDTYPTLNYFNAASLMVQYGLTVGCKTAPLQYCPTEFVTRRQMAVFIVRAIFGGGIAGNNFTYSTTPYFTDVPATDVNFKYVQKLRDLGITSGCAATAYCPDARITRDQMAVFIVRARLGAATQFTTAPTPYFTDVPANYQPATFFSAIQKIKEMGITVGCTATQYCPSQFVDRGNMAIFIMRGTFNRLMTPGMPVLTQVLPSVLTTGTSSVFTITGANTSFVQGTTTLSPIPGVTMGPITVASPTSLLVQLTATESAVRQPYSLVAVTGTEEAVLPNGLMIQ